MESRTWLRYGRELAGPVKSVEYKWKALRGPSLWGIGDAWSAVFQLAGAFGSAVETMVQTGNVPMHIQGFPRGCCGIISEVMGDYLNTVGIGEFFYVCGMKDGASHAWLEVDGLIVDITGDQFADRPGIYVDKPDAWYGEWEEDIKHLAVHKPSAFFYGEERRFLERVLEHINRNEAAGAGLPK